MRILRTLVPYVRRYQARYAGGFGMLLFRGLLAAALPYLIGQAIDSLAQMDTRAATTYAVLLLGFAALKGVAQYGMRWILITISRDIEYDLRNDLTAHLIRLDRRFYSRYSTGDLMARATNDLAQVRSLLGPGLMYTAEISVVLVAVLAVMAWTDWILTLLVFAPMPLISLAVGLFGRRAHERFQEVQRCFAGISTRVQEHLAGLRMLRAYNQDRQETERFGYANAEYLEANLGLVRIWKNFYPTLDFLVGVTGITVLGCGGWRVLQGEITVGGFTMFIYFLAMLMWPMVGMGVVVNITQRGVASLGRLNQLFRHHPRIADAAAGKADPAFLRGGIEWRSVTVRYPSAAGAALEDISLSVPETQSLALIGPVGSGKSTMVNLLPRLLDPTEGQVLVDSVDTRRLPLSELRACIGHVPQETYLFSRTIAENIRLGRLDASKAQVREAAHLAMLDAETDSFPDGIDTLVGERGITLSGGQKQRVAVARALLREPRILILDDATSSVDAETEYQMLRRIRSGAWNCTVVIVTHRVSAARLADRIAVLDCGRIAATGTHEELLARDGLYARMHQRQRIEEELARE